MDINLVGPPKQEHLNLPFFAYGNFKPGQLAYHQIETYVKGEPSAEIIEHEMLYRDGLALISCEENETFKTSGHLIEFNAPEEAYEVIGKSQYDTLYKWKQIQVNGKPANALVGKKENRGSFKNRDYTLSIYDYRHDHFFNEAVKVIEDTIEKFDGKNITNMKDFFKFQMNYMLLWSIIERFSTLCYGYSQDGPYIFKIAEEESFRNKLRDNPRKDVIYSSDCLFKKKLRPHNHWKSIRYYYTIRCNVVHKGKYVKDEDRNKLKYSLEELFGLFGVVYNEKTTQNDKIREKYPEKKSLENKQVINE